MPFSILLVMIGFFQPDSAVAQQPVGLPTVELNVKCSG